MIEHRLRRLFFDYQYIIGIKTEISIYLKAYKEILDNKDKMKLTRNSILSTRS